MNSLIARSQYDAFVEISQRTISLCRAADMIHYITSFKTLITFTYNFKILIEKVSFKVNDDTLLYNYISMAHLLYAFFDIEDDIYGLQNITIKSLASYIASSNFVVTRIVK